MKVSIEPVLALPIQMPRSVPIAPAARDLCVQCTGQRCRTIDHIDPVLVVKGDRARSPEMCPQPDESPLLVEDLDPIVAPIGNEELASGIHREVMRIVEQTALSGCRVDPASDLHDERPILRKFDQTVIAAAMPIRDPDLAIGGDQHMGRPVEVRLVVPGDGRFAQGHQYLSLRAQLEDLAPPCRV